MSSKMVITSAVVASCALHGAVLWFFNAPAYGLRSSKVLVRGQNLSAQVRYLRVKPTATTDPALTPTPAPQRVIPEPKALVPEDTPLEDETMTGNPGSGAYLPTTLLDVEPVVVQDIPYDPPELLGRTESGTIVLTLMIGASGVVDKVVVESSDLPEVFTEVTRRDFLEARFNPGLRDAKPVPSMMRIEVTFGSGS